MNLTRALNVALPEIPARTLAQRYPRLDPGHTFREHIEDGQPVVRVYIPSVEGMYKLPPQNWALIQLFDGKRSYEEIAELYSRQCGHQYGAEEIREFASHLEAAGFWYKTPQEKNILLLQQTTEGRREKVKVWSKFADLSLIVFPAFNPDRFLTWLYGHTRFIYTAWFTTLTLLAFALTTGISITHWSEIGRDTLQFYNFADKTWVDLPILYSLGMFVVAVHEFAHAHACKHYGARVPAMGFALVFLTPAFYTDTTEGAVLGSRYQRLIISLAGIWSELMICSIVTPIWWGTPPDTPIHNAAYFLMMLTGMASLLINWNPLMKLDGYHMLCEIIGIADLKETSTEYVAAWVKRHIWKLPVEVPYVPKRRRFGFVVYALLSGAYSYMVLYVVARFAGNVSRHFNPEWAFIPELAVAALIFKSRIRLLVNFMKFVYLDKKERVLRWFTPRRSVAIAGGLGIFLSLPLWHDSTSGRFVLEPAEQTVVRSIVPGTLTDVFAEEGQAVETGATLARLRNLPLQSRLANMQSRYVIASHRAAAAILRNTAYGPALKERDELAVETDQLFLQTANLEITSPISGIVMTPRLRDRVGAYVTEGSELLEIADIRVLRARIYVSEYDLYKVRRGAPARLQVEGVLQKWEAHTAAIAPVSREIDPALLNLTKYKGLHPPQFYVVNLFVANEASRLKPGMTGVARIYGQRRGLAGLTWEGIVNFLGRKIW
jgi:putative peptide zinc metalloprotease protein